MEEDWSDEEEAAETYLVVEFAGNTGEDALKQEDLSMKIIGMEAEQPLVQIGNQLYAGEYTETFGTELIFTEEECRRPIDPVFETRLDTQLSFAAKTTKKLVIKRAFATAKKAAEEMTDPDSADLASKLSSAWFCISL